MVYLRGLEKEKQARTKYGRREETVQVKVEINRRLGKQDKTSAKVMLVFFKYKWNQQTFS